MNLYEVTAFLVEKDADGYKTAMFLVRPEYVFADCQDDAEKRFLLSQSDKLVNYRIEQVTILVRPFCYS